MPCQNHPDVLDGLVVCWRCRREFCAANCAIELRDCFFCAGCKTAQVRDVLAGTDAAGMDLATLDKRLGAWLIDGLIKFGIALAIRTVSQIIMTAFIDMRSPTAAFRLIGFSLVISLIGYGLGMGYEGLMLANNKGQTLGKMAVKIRVVTAEGNPISKRQAWWRAALKLMLFCVGCETCVGVMLDGVFALGDERASLHDLGAKTRVINSD